MYNWEKKKIFSTKPRKKQIFRQQGWQYDILKEYYNSLFQNQNLLKFLTWTQSAKKEKSFKRCLKTEQFCAYQCCYTYMYEQNSLRHWKPPRAVRSDHDLNFQSHDGLLAVEKSARLCSLIAKEYFATILFPNTILGFLLEIYLRHESFLKSPKTQLTQK